MPSITGAYFAGAVPSLVAGQRALGTLWNPPNSGKTLLVDHLVTANPNTIPSAADLRFCTAPIGTKATNGFNKILGDPHGAGEIWVGNVPAANIPQNGGVLSELWGGSRYESFAYHFDDPVVIRPGYGLVVAGWMDGEQAIGSFQWREETIDGWVPPPAEFSGGSVTGNVSPLSVLSDGDPASYATRSAASFSVGRSGYSSAKVLTKIEAASPNGRSLNGRGEPGVYTWTIFGIDSAGSEHIIGSGNQSYATSDASSRQVISVAPTDSTPYVGHRLEVLDSKGDAGWRVASLRCFVEAS